MFLCLQVLIWGLTHPVNKLSIIINVYNYACSVHACSRYFPSIFGPDEDQPLNKKLTMEKFQALTDEVSVVYKCSNNCF